MTVDELIVRLEALRALHPGAGGAQVDAIITPEAITYEQGRVRLTVLPTLREGRA